MGTSYKTYSSRCVSNNMHDTVYTSNFIAHRLTNTDSDLL
jgi:hypothetical protein